MDDIGRDDIASEWSRHRQAAIGIAKDLSGRDVLNALSPREGFHPRVFLGTGNTNRDALRNLMPKPVLNDHRMRKRAHPQTGTGPSKMIPVSYTHLRAHETRHDLVC